MSKQEMIDATRAFQAALKKTARDETWLDRYIDAVSDLSDGYLAEVVSEVKSEILHYWEDSIIGSVKGGPGGTSRDIEVTLMEGRGVPEGGRVKAVIGIVLQTEKGGDAVLQIGARIGRAPFAWLSQSRRAGSPSDEAEGAIAKLARSHDSWAVDS